MRVVRKPFSAMWAERQEKPVCGERNKEGASAKWEKQDREERKATPWFLPLSQFQVLVPGELGWSLSLHHTPL